MQFNLKCFSLWHEYKHVLATLGKYCLKKMVALNVDMRRGGWTSSNTFKWRILRLLVCRQQCTSYMEFCKKIESLNWLARNLTGSHPHTSILKIYMQLNAPETMSSFNASGDLMVEDDTGLGTTDTGHDGGDAESGMAGDDGLTARRRGEKPGTKRGRYNRVSTHAR